MDPAEDRLMGYGEPRYDQSAKNILSDKSILAHILKSTVSEFKDASIEDIANVYIVFHRHFGLCGEYRICTGKRSC